MQHDHAAGLLSKVLVLLYLVLSVPQASAFSEQVTWWLGELFPTVISQSLAGRCLVMEKDPM